MKIIENQELKANLYKSYLIKNKKIYNTISKINANKNDAMETVCLYVISPAITEFVMWVLSSAIKTGKRRLYFLSRDGYFMYLIARLFCKKFNFCVECKYLSCSRYSVRVPLFHLDLDFALDFICTSRRDNNINKILKRAGLLENQIQNILNELGYGFKRYENISCFEINKIRNKLRKSDLFINYMKRNSMSAAFNFFGYLRQRGLMDNIPMAIVDSGWEGTMQNLLQKSMNYMGSKQKIEGYYWGLYSTPSGTTLHYNAYFFGPNNGLRKKVIFNNCLFESIYSAPHGMTLGYEKLNGIYVPVYGSTDKINVKFIYRVKNYIIKYVNLFLNEISEKDFYETPFYDNNMIIEKLFKLFMNYPNRQEAEVFGKLSFSDDILDSERDYIASFLTGRELKMNNLIGKTLIKYVPLFKNIKTSAWYEGSAVLYSKTPNKYIKFHQIYKYIRFIKKSLGLIINRKGAKN